MKGEQIKLKEHSHFQKGFLRFEGVDFQNIDTQKMCLGSLYLHVLHKRHLVVNLQTPSIHKTTLDLNKGWG